MKIIILTTKTPHHLYFVRQISNSYKISAVISETSFIKPSFETHHKFEDFREKYEIENLLGGKLVDFKDYSLEYSVESINDSKCYEIIKSIEPDIILTFGTGIIRRHIINLCPDGFLNLHGGCPENYRGLDTHMWAIYHKEFNQLITTLHILEPRLDAGNIVSQKMIFLSKNKKIYQLRAQNTEICVELSISAIDYFNKNGYFKSKKQIKKGRYYSFMPSVLKDICVNNFNNYLKKL